MSNINITPLQDWISNKIGITPQNITRDALTSYQIKKIKEVISYAQKNSFFYYKHLKNINPNEINTLDDIKKLPFTTKDEIINDPFSMVCVKHSMIDRIVTLTTSGTTGQKKRIFFTNNDQELTIDFFANGMQTMVNAGDKVLILMPGQTPGSIGDLLKKGLERIGVEGIVYGPIINVSETYDFMLSAAPNCIVGIPNQIFALAQSGDIVKNPEKCYIKSVLLSTDNVPKSICDEISNRWECKVFNHYGMTEMGLGGGVDCQALYGYHLREADMYFEIINPLSGMPVTEGTLGEVVFTTLNREAMPLIRYRTGDLSCFKPNLCPCGTILKTMAPIRGRLENIINFGDGVTLSLSIIDEILFSFKEVLDYQITVTSEDKTSYLNIILKIPTDSIDLKIIENALLNIDAVTRIKKLKLKLSFDKIEKFENTGTTKRIIRDLRQH